MKFAGTRNYSLIFSAGLNGGVNFFHPLPPGSTGAQQRGFQS